MSESQVMLITGSRKGIGRALVEHYVARGHKVYGCSRGAADFELPGYRHFELDVADEAAAKRLFKAIRSAEGRLDVLINNAGAASMNHSLLTPISKVRDLLEVNFVGTFLYCREAAKLMQRHHYGRIVNFTTVAVPLRLEGEAAYGAAKAGVLSLTQVLARELAELGITVNAVGPGPVDTDLIRAVPDDKVKKILARQAIARFGEFKDVIHVVDFFVDPGSDFITGQVLFLGGVG